MKIAAIIPCYNCAAQVEGVVRNVPFPITHIYVVDDACPQHSGKVAESVGDKRVQVIYHPHNKGVGGAVLSGMQAALADNIDIIIKLDGDGQMDVQHIPAFLTALEKADYAKGNRFGDLVALRTMPRYRLLLNSLLSFAVKAASGYWHVIDPANGYIAVKTETLRKLNLQQLARGYFFESDMLCALSLVNAKVVDVPIPARYGEEQSQVNLPREVFSFAWRLPAALCKRIGWQYFLTDFNIASLYILFGLPMFVGGFFMGLWAWQESILTGVPRTTGTVMLIFLPLILGFQMLLAAIAVDMQRSDRLRVQ